MFTAFSGVQCACLRHSVVCSARVYCIQRHAVRVFTSCIGVQCACLRRAVACSARVYVVQWSGALYAVGIVVESRPINHSTVGQRVWECVWVCVGGCVRVGAVREWVGVCGSWGGQQGGRGVNKVDEGRGRCVANVRKGESKGKSWVCAGNVAVRSEEGGSEG